MVGGGTVQYNTNISIAMTLPQSPSTHHNNKPHYNSQHHHATAFGRFNRDIELWGTRSQHRKESSKLGLSSELSSHSEFTIPSDSWRPSQSPAVERGRAVERKHGRVAMAAVIGTAVHNNHITFHGYLMLSSTTDAPPWWESLETLPPKPSLGRPCTSNTPPDAFLHLFQRRVGSLNDIIIAIIIIQVYLNLIIGQSTAGQFTSKPLAQKLATNVVCQTYVSPA